MFEPKPPRLADADWQRIQHVTRTADVSLGSVTNLMARSQSEREQLLARAVELSPEQLQQIEGTYYQERFGVFELVRSGSNLKAGGDVLLVAVGQIGRASCRERV